MDVSELCVGCMEARGVTPVCVRCGWDDRTDQDLPIALPYRTILREQYVFGRALGHGGFGITYLGWDINLDLKVAIKEYLPGDLATRSADRVTVTPYSGQREYFDYGLSNFLDEGRALARFHDHPNIVTVLNFFKEHGTGYLVMSYIPGRTFKEYLEAQDDSRVPFDTAVNVMMPVMDALREVHAIGLLHRDISPDNIYLTEGGQVKLIDFGAARYAIGAKSKNLSVVLKPGYAPWEQYQSRGDQGAWTDVYAVGATIYRAVTGITPPQAPDRIDRDELEAPSRLGVAIPAEAERALLESLAVKMQDRFASISDLQQPLLQALSGAPSRDTRNRDAHDDGRERHDDDNRRRGSGGNAQRGAGAQSAPVLAGLETVVQRLTEWGHVVRRRVQRLVPALALPREHTPTMAVVAGIVAGLIGLLGTTGTFSELLGLTPTSQVFAMFFPGLVVINKLATLVSLAVNAALLLGAVQWLRGDARGPVIVWGAAWALVALVIVNVVWFVIAAPFTPGWNSIVAATQGALIGGAFSLAFSALVQLGLVIVLVWKSGPKPGAAAPREAGPRS